MIHIEHHARHCPEYLTEHFDEMYQDAINGDLCPEHVWTKWRDRSRGAIKEALEAESHQKCAWCESKLGLTCFGQVDHYRPKSHYRWLMFLWGNLLPSCQVCNTRKRNHFPLEIESDRAKGPNDDLIKEKPLLINPAIEDPLNHILFDEHRAIGRTGPGKETIKRLALNREQLCKDRRDRLAFVSLALSDAKRHGKHDVVSAQLAAPDSPYSAAVRAFINGERAE